MNPEKCLHAWAVYIADMTVICGACDTELFWVPAKQIVKSFPQANLTAGYVKIHHAKRKSTKNPT